MYYLIGDKYLNAWNRVIPLSLRGSKDRFAVLDGDTLRCREMPGDGVYKIWRNGLEFSMVDGHFWGITEILAFQDGDWVRFPDISVKFESTMVELHPEGVVGCFRVELRAGLPYFNGVQLYGFTGFRMRLKWLFNLGAGVYRVVIQFANLVAAYKFNAYLDVQGMGVLFMECGWGGNTWEVHGSGLGYSPRRDWFLGRLAKHRMLCGNKPLFEV